jgi:hypothetical protein
MRSARPAVAPYHTIFGTEQDVFRSPKRLRFDKIDSVFRLVDFALP